MADLILSALFNAGSEIYRRWNGRKLVNEKLRYLLQSVEEAQARIMFWKKTLQNADTEETGLRMMEDYNLKNKFENLITALQVSTVHYIYTNIIISIFIFILILLTFIYTSTSTPYILLEC